MSDHGHLSDVVVDVDDPALATALADAFAPHHVHPCVAATIGDGVRAVTDVSAGVVVVAAEAAPSATLGADELHERLALRVRRWIEAAPVVGARVVVVSRDDVFDPDRVPSGGHDEFAVPDAVDQIGRARRAGEGQVRPGVDALVRAADGDDPVALADLVHWAAVGRHAGAWHLPGGTGGVLHADHTRLVRSAGASAPPRTDAT